MTIRYLEQRFYPVLQIGPSLTVSRGLYNTPVHVQQGVWDGACGPHCAAMALTILGRISTVATLCDRKKGVAARLWKASQEKYFEGLNVKDLTRLMTALDVDLHIGFCYGGHQKCRNFIESQWDMGRLIIVSWHSRTNNQHHWVLTIGMEGVRKEKIFSPHTLLVLDSSAPEIGFCAYNGRLEFAQSTSKSRPRGATYLSSDGSVFPVTLTGAVAVGEL